MKLCSVILLLLASTGLAAQEAVLSSGSYHRGSAASLSWSLGELSVTTLRAGGVILTQGVQQARLTATPAGEPAGVGLGITAYPNPATDYLTVSMGGGGAGSAHLALHDLHGRVILRERLAGSPHTLNLSGIPPAVYVLRVYEGGRELKTFRVVKHY